MASLEIGNDMDDTLLEDETVLEDETLHNDLTACAVERPGGES